MRISILLLFLVMTQAHADVGKILKVLGARDSYLLRNKMKFSLSEEAPLQEGDEIFTENSHIVLQLFPSSQLSLPKGTQIILSQALLKEGEKQLQSESVIDLVKGLVRVQVLKEEEVNIEQKVQAPGVAFGVRGTDFEVAINDGEVLLDVYEGEVEVTSPHVHTFVPYFVNSQEGFQFSRRNPAFAKKAFRPRMKEAGFVPAEEVRSRWKKKKNRFLQKRQKPVNKSEARPDRMLKNSAERARSGNLKKRVKRILREKKKTR